ncbi:MAG: hypothetical protein WCN95_05175 [bacterium]
MNSNERFFDRLDEIDALLSHASSSQLRSRLLELIDSSAVAFNYAFSQVARSDWLVSLSEKGVFTESLRSQTAARAGADNSWLWTPSEYLKRMAKLDDHEVSRQVLDIMIEVGDTKNCFVHRDFAEAALCMPAELAGTWARHEVEWLRDGNSMAGLLEDALGQLMSKLAREGQTALSLVLGEELLAVLPDPAADEKTHIQDEVQRLLHSSLEPTIRCDRYSYEEILRKNLPDLVHAAHFETLVLLCRLLEKAVQYALPEGERAKPHDLTYISRTAVEDHAQNRDYKIDCPLITAVRNTAETICKEQPDRIKDVVAKIEGFEWDIFKRISLHLLRVSEGAPMELIKERLLDETAFNSVRLHHEYFHLIKKCFGKLSPNDRNTILGRIEAAKAEKALLAEHEPELSEVRCAQRVRCWQHRELVPIQEYLSGEWKDRFKALENEFKDTGLSADFHAYITTGWGDAKSPKEPAELAKLSFDDLLSYLKTWKPTGGWDAPTRNSLGSAIKSVVVQQPEVFANGIQRLTQEHLDPTYLRSIVSGLYESVAKSKTLLYKPLLSFCKWIVAQETTIAVRTVPEGLKKEVAIDADWSTTRLEIAHVFEKVFDDEPRLPFELRAEIWPIIEALTKDPKPDLEYEQRYGGKNMDAMTMSLNTVRGAAMHATMRYAMWVCRNLVADLKTKKGREPNWSDLPEVKAVLEKHLDIRNSIYGVCETDRAIYGQWLPQLAHVSNDWVKSNLPLIFPRDQGHRRLRDAAWTTYLAYSRLYDSVFELLHDIYKEEVQDLALISADIDKCSSLQERLIDHCIVMYSRGMISLADGDLVDVLFSSVSEEPRRLALDLAGRSTTGEDSMSRDIAQRLRELWDWRLRKVGGYDKMPQKELSAFGSWFAGGKLGEDWAFPHLENVVSRSDLANSSPFVFQYMAKVFKAYPINSLRCLELFIPQNKDPWFFRRSEGGVWPILEQAMKHADGQIRDKAETIIHHLGSLGNLEYRDLLTRAVRPEDGSENKETSHGES